MFVNYLVNYAELLERKASSINLWEDVFAKLVNRRSAGDHDIYGWLRKDVGKRELNQSLVGDTEVCLNPFYSVDPFHVGRSPEKMITLIVWVEFCRFCVISRKKPAV